MQKDYPSTWAAITAIAPKIGCTPETLRAWHQKHLDQQNPIKVQQISDQEKMKQMEREIKELKRANEILRKAAAFFAQAELRSYALYLELQQQGIDNKINDANVILDYEYVANSIDKPAVLLKNWNNGTLKIKFSQDQFLAEFYCRDQHGNEQLLELNQDIDPFSFFNNVQNEIVNWVKVKNAVEGAA
jgi:transposase